MSKFSVGRSGTVPKYHSLRATATAHQLEAARLMQMGQFQRASEILDKAIMLLNTVPEQHRFVG